MKRNIRSLIAYNGTHYFGWQKTRMGPSIEETLELCLQQILQHPVELQAASRTDRGVHAEGQVVNFFTDKPKVDLKKLHLSLAKMLPKDISPLALEEVETSFHPTLDSKGKEYQYQICNLPIQLPFLKDYSWHIPTPLDLPSMLIAKEFLLGTHDFSAFTNERTDDTIRTIHSIEIEPGLFKIKGDKFLYKMVRNIVGTLVYVGLGKIPPTEIPTILSSRNRALAGMTAPAHGLCLKQVFY